MNYNINIRVEGTATPDDYALEEKKRKGVKRDERLDHKTLSRNRGSHSG